MGGFGLQVEEFAQLISLVLLSGCAAAIIAGHGECAGTGDGYQPDSIAVALQVDTYNVFQRDFPGVTAYDRLAVQYH